MILKHNENQNSLQKRKEKHDNIFLRNKDDKLTKAEFVAGMTGHPVIAKILSHKTIDALLETF